MKKYLSIMSVFLLCFAVVGGAVTLTDTSDSKVKGKLVCIGCSLKMESAVQCIRT